MKLLFSSPGTLSDHSLSELCSDLAIHQVPLSKEALNKRLNEHTVLFLQEVFFALFELQKSLPLPGIQLATTLPFNRIRILDGTTVALSSNCQSDYPSSVGAGVKFQVEVDYLTGQFQYVKIQPAKAADCPAGRERLATIRKGDLFLQDLGYYQYTTFEQINEKHAFYVSRARTDTMFYIDHPTPRYHPNGKMVERSAYEQLFIKEEMKTLHPGEMRNYPRVYLGRHKKLPCRLVLYRMTVAEQRRQAYRVKRRDQTKHGTIKQKSLDLVGVSMLVTNLPDKVPTEEIVALYRYRWQIELLFRSWKSNLKLDQFRRMKQARWECHIYAELILLLLSTLVAYQLRVRFWKERHFVLSEQIAIHEIPKKIGMHWRIRDGTDWQCIHQKIELTLNAIGRKKVWKPGPINWL